MMNYRIFQKDPTPPPSVPEGATGPNAGNLGASDLYGFDEKD